MNMKAFQHNLLRWSLIGIFGLAAIAVAGAFLGAERAKLFFHSPLMTAIWFFLLLCLLAGLVFSARVRRRPASWAMHLGCLLILAGSMWNSSDVHRWRVSFGLDAGPYSGFMRLKPGETSDRLADASLSRFVGPLPFSIRLDDFRIEHYPLETDPWVLGAGITVPSRQGMAWVIQPLKCETGQVVNLPYGDIRMRMLSRSPREPSSTSPVIEMQLIRGADAVRRTLGGDPGRSFYQLPLSPLFPEGVFSNRSASVLLSRQEPPVRDYVSRVTVMKDAKAVLQRAIEVNQPLHYGGYHIYQHSCDGQTQRYTILYAVKDSGVSLALAGFVLLGLGAAVQFWLQPRRPKNGGAS